MKSERDYIAEARAIKKEKTFSSEGWFHVQSDFFFEILKHVESLVLAYLIWLACDLTRTSQKKPLDWFYCTVVKLYDILRIDKHTQARVLNTLERKGYILRKQIGIPPRRHIRIDYDKIEADVEIARIKVLEERDKRAEAAMRKRDEALAYSTNTPHYSN